MTELAFASKSNAELIAACHRLGFVGGAVMDPTYGRGRFWTQYTPDDFTTNDQFVSNPSGHRYDFRALPADWEDRFDSVTFDPPYKLNGTGGEGPGDAAYGVATPYTHWKDINRLCIDGGIECLRTVKPGGFLLFKCKDQVSSGAKRFQSFDFKEAIEAAGSKLVDRAFVESYIAQPAGRRQVHFRENTSVMLIFRKNKKRGNRQ